MECSLLDAPNNGYVDIDSYRVGSIARFSCKEGFEIVGHSHSVCLVTGEFSPSTLPQCERKLIYFILSSEINAYQKQIKVISITSEMIWYQSLVIGISLYFHCSVFWITSDFSIHLMQLTSKFQTPITFLFVKKNIKYG